MTGISWSQLILFLIVLVASSVPLGRYMERVYGGNATLVQRLVGPVERLFYRVAGVEPDREMDWKTYTVAVLVFNLVGALVLYLVLRLQGHLPVNPAGLGAVTPEVAFNTAVSFTSNTNWQVYGGETTLSHLSQMVGLTVQNFVSAATGMAVLVALVRGFVRREAGTLGNFWVDLTRTVLYVLLPLSVLLAVVLSAEGVVQTLDGSTTARLVEPASNDGGGVGEQIIALGPVASQVAIKQLGTNGGGFFNVNSAHPFENPTPLSNFLQMVAILLIPAALCVTFGRMVGQARQGTAIYAAMLLLFVPLVGVTVFAEQSGNPVLAGLGVDHVGSAQQAGGNMEGKETRFGIGASALWAVATTAASNGSVNAMHDSFSPIGGLVPMWLMQLGEVVFGGVGSGLYGMIIYAIVSVFIAGLMVGRTPEYLGKKIEAFDVKMAALVILLPSASVLVGTALACVVPAGTATLGNPGAHGFSEILYAFSSGSNNNGSAFGGITVSGPFYAIGIGVVMLIGRFWVIVPVMALAGNLAAKRGVPVTAGTLPTHTPLFVLLLSLMVILVGALTFIPALALGPIVEHFTLLGS